MPPVKRTSAPTALEDRTAATAATEQKRSSLIPKKTRTPLKHDVFQHLLTLHPDRVFVNMLLDMIRHGAEIGFTSPHHVRYTPNAFSACIHSDILSVAINKEVTLGHTAGPFRRPPFDNFTVSSLGVRPKKSGGHRIILDLSRPDGDSVNDFIDKKTFSLSFCSVDNAVTLITRAGNGALLSKLDIKHAFRRIPVKLADWHLLGYKVKNEY